MSFPRISGVGNLILITYIAVIKDLFDKSSYGYSFQSGGMLSSSISLNSLTMSASLLNSLSHSAVVLGALNDTYVLSIIVGVGFDVMTRVIHLIWWIHITRISSQNVSGTLDFFSDFYTFAFLLVLSIIFILHMIIHMRALQLNHSYELLTKTLNGALNNLRGVPGNRFQDHIFAYSDLGGHLLPFGLSMTLLKKQNALLAGSFVFVIMLIFFASVLSKIPFNRFHDDRPVLRIKPEGKIICQCDVCMKKSVRKNDKCAFTLNVYDGICRLWLYSFEELYQILNQDSMKRRTDNNLLKM